MSYLRKRAIIFTMIMLFGLTILPVVLTGAPSKVGMLEDENIEAHSTCSPQNVLRIGGKRHTVEVQQEEIYTTNKTTHGWVMKIPNIISEYENISALTTVRNPRDNGSMYLILATYNDSDVNRTFYFHLIRVNVSYFNITNRRVSVSYEEIAIYTVETDKAYNPIIKDMDAVILKNQTLYFAVVFYPAASAVKFSSYLMVRYDNVSVKGQSFTTIDYSDDYYGLSMFITNVRLAYEGSRVVSVISLGYYQSDASGTLYVFHVLQYRVYDHGRSIYNVTLGLNKPKYLSNVIVINNITYVAFTIYIIHYDQDAIVYSVLNITSGNTSIEGFAVAGAFMDYFNDVPEYKYISLGAYNNSTHINLVTLFEAHTDFKQALIYHTATVYYNSTANETNIQEIGFDILSQVDRPSQIKMLDTVLADNKTAFLVIKYNVTLGMYVPSHVLFAYNTTVSKEEKYIWLGPYDFDVGAGTLTMVDAVMYPDQNIYGFAYLPTPEKNALYPIVIFRDADRDFLGNWEEINVFNTLPNNPDSDNGGVGDGINDGAEKYVYKTDPLSNDTDKDGLDDKFELEVHPNTVYPEYNNIKNFYRTDPLVNDTDGDNITDYQEVTGDYTVDGRLGYPTNPTRKDTDGDGLDDYTEIFVGIEYWVNSTSKKYYSYPNATLFDTDGDNISDRKEALKALDPTSNDTDGDNITDYDEINIYKTNPHVVDTDGDGLGDGEEIEKGTKPLDKDTDDDNVTDGDEVLIYHTNPLSQDTDSDGLSDGEEILKYNTTPTNPDTDNDNITDSTEVKEYGTNPKSNDTDSDGLSDYMEIYGFNITSLNKTSIRTDPLNNDTDGDGLLDGEEYNYGTDPTSSDTDGDGLTDYQEIIVHSTDPTNPDPDGDNLLDSDEIQHNTNPFNNDTDGDHLTDYEEVVKYGTNPLENDTDADNITDYDEINGINITGIGLVKTDPLDNDTDVDGLSDGLEVQMLLNPISEDTDGDLITDYDEIYKYNTDPRTRDSDGDFISDYDEIFEFRTDPTSNDTDKDGLTDGEEVYGINITAIGLRQMDPFSNDTDDDKLSDYEEVYVYHTDPTDSDTDGDGLSDYEEISIGTQPTLDDTDGDGLIDGKETLIGTDPLNPDSDDDGLEDGTEVAGISIEGIGVRKTDPLRDDTDSDGLTDSREVELGTDPTSSDTDNDGLSDKQEVETGSDPRNEDSDGDGLRDGEEYSAGTLILDNDTDDDGLTDYEEVVIYGTYPDRADSDSDNITDGMEVSLGTNPLSADTDGDGLTDYDEIFVYNTNATDTDTDDDGLSDWEDVNYGADPNNPDTDGDGLSDYDEVKIRGTDPSRRDTDSDGIPDSIDLLFPRSPDWYLICLVAVTIFLFWARSYGLFRNWKKDILSAGLSDLGGILMFVIPEDFKMRYDANLISSGLLGIHTLTGEIVGKALKRLVLSGEVPVLLISGEKTIMWVFLKKAYPRIIGKLEKIHEELESMYEELLESWSGIEEELEDVKIWLSRKIELAPIKERIEVEDKDLIEEFEREFGQ